MEGFTDFLVANYFWFLVISFFLIFALIGYFVDQNEQKKGISKINKEKAPEKDIHELASEAANKSLNSAVNDLNKNSSSTINNTITDMNTNQVSQGPVGFDVLNK